MWANLGPAGAPYTLQGWRNLEHDVEEEEWKFMSALPNLVEEGNVVSHELRPRDRQLIACAVAALPNNNTRTLLETCFVRVYGESVDDVTFPQVV